MKKLIFFAAAMLMCFSTACSNSDDEQFEVLLKNLDITFTVTPLEDFNEVFELKAGVSGDTNKAQNVFSSWQGDKYVIDVEYLTCPASISLNIERVPKTSLVIDESRTYQLKYNIDTVIHKYYNDGTTKVINVPTLPQGGSVLGTKMAAYLDRVNGKIEPFIFNFNEGGDKL